MDASLAALRPGLLADKRVLTSDGIGLSVAKA